MFLRPNKQLKDEIVMVVMMLMIIMAPIFYKLYRDINIFNAFLVQNSTVLCSVHRQLMFNMTGGNKLMHNTVQHFVILQFNVI